MEIFGLNQRNLKCLDGTLMLNDQLITLDKQDVQAILEIYRINGKSPADYLEMAKSLSIKEAQVEHLERELRNYE